MKRNVAISDILQPLAEKPTQAYLTNVLQVADVLEWVLEQVGKSEVWQTSFSISDEFLRRLFFIKKSNAVSKILLVLDRKATNKTLRLWAFITQVIQHTYLADNHSKIILVKSETGQKVSIITSQNLTRGNRHESALVTTEPELFDTLHASIENLIRHHSVPMNDVFAERVGTKVT